MNGQFWVTVEQVAQMTQSSLRVMDKQFQSSRDYEAEQLRLLMKKCERQLAVVEGEIGVASSSGNCKKPIVSLRGKTDEKNITR
ncbi:hypothetical protein [Photobacterium sp. 1_MG-2023]|uniref:hypothetical protein n=1 Tax=Photobacterium sp. 1_MG-2023 TaxID=3062646 RepID=UPI0026E1CE23|nr:hypothetical protein [Photobacterium sp. 1_MG-2023]MDO6707956.1 hypothetical protein [Photobacterium sp. 1_MG-2023]